MWKSLTPWPHCVASAWVLGYGPLDLLCSVWSDSVPWNLTRFFCFSNLQNAPVSCWPPLAWCYRYLVKSGCCLYLFISSGGPCFSPKLLCPWFLSQFRPYGFSLLLAWSFETFLPYIGPRNQDEFPAQSFKQRNCSKPHCFCLFPPHFQKLGKSCKASGSLFSLSLSLIPSHKPLRCILPRPAM